jgi:hypothetical protein
MNGNVEGQKISRWFFADKDDSKSGEKSSSLESFFANLVNFDFELNILSVKIKEFTWQGKRNALVVDWNVEGHYLKVGGFIGLKFE